MYLSRLLLDPRSRTVHRGLADCQELHRTIMAAFPQITKPDDNARERFGILHRLEVDHRSNRLTLYVQSREAPDWSNLPRGYLQAEAAVKPVDPAYRSLQTGAVLSFRLKANPSKRLNSARIGPDGRSRLGARVELRREEEQIDWLRRKGEQGGFDLLGVRVLAQAKEQGRRQRQGGPGSTLTLAGVVFEGHLRITDTEKFYHHSLARGIGPGKAYGLGLLSLAPPLRRWPCA